MKARMRPYVTNRFAGTAAAAAALLCLAPALRGDTLAIAGRPLEIRADERGTVGVRRYAGDTPVPQYYATFAKGSVLFAAGADPALRWGSGTGTFALWDDAVTGRFAAVSHTQPDPWTLRTTLATPPGAPPLDVVQTLAYSNGAAFYDLTWQIRNTGQAALTNLAWIHGGDVSPAGEDFAAGFWDAAAGMVYVRTTNVADGIMGLMGQPASPAAHHMAAHFQLVRDAAKSGALTDTADGSLHDAAYALQWRHERLEPGEVWTVAARELWSAAGTLLVAAPPGQSAVVGTSLTYDFRVWNYQSIPDIVDLALSGHAWPSVLLGTNRVALAPGSNTVVRVRVDVPPTAVPGTTDRLTLLAQSVEQQAVTSAAAVVTLALAAPPRYGEVVCTLAPAEAVAAGARWRLTGGGETNWQASGAVVTNVEPGARTIAFREVAGWTRPADVGVLVAAGVRTATNGVYTVPPPRYGEVACTLAPAEAVAAGARWRLTGGGETNWQASGSVVTNVEPGARTIAFREVAGWTRPADVSVLVAAGARTATNGVYTVVPATNVQQDVTGWLLHPLFESWRLNRQTGTLLGTLRLRNVGTRPLAGPFWLAIVTTADQRFVAPTAALPDGRGYLNLTVAVNAAAGDGRLDPGETVTIPDIEVYTSNRAVPADSAFSVWATPVGANE